MIGGRLLALAVGVSRLASPVALAVAGGALVVLDSRAVGRDLLIAAAAIFVINIARRLVVGRRADRP